MANGWARDGAVQDQIDDMVSDAIRAARAIAARRGERCLRGLRRQYTRRAAQGVARDPHLYRLPIEARAAIHPAGINRRGSKDSQLR